jgi:hypothetical protein
MANNFKFNKEGNEKNSIFKGKWAVGLTSGMGPTEQTDFYNGITPPVGGYSLYLNKPSGGPSVYTPSSDGELIELINTSFNKNFSNIEDCLEFISIDDDLFCQKNNIDKIITDGLVLYLDASNLMSYPKKGKTWKDLSGNSHEGTLISGAYFDNFDNESILFDGSDDKVVFNNLDELDFLDNFTISFFAKQNPEVSQVNARIISNGKYDDYGYEIFVDTDGVELRTYNPTSFISHGAKVDTSTWKYYSFIKNLTSSQILILPDNKISIGSATEVVYDNHNFTLGTRSTSNSYFYGGNLALLQCYNRALTETEILQNYNQTKQRFGL